MTRYHLFFLRVVFAGCCLGMVLFSAGCRQAAEAPMPPDLPLPSLPLNGEAWTRDAVIVQLWGKSHWEGIVNAGRRAPWLAEAFGFNTVTVVPPEAHNAISAPEHQITDEQFSLAMDLFRLNGFRIILYSSIMHCGHAPVWQDGTLAREHPEWSQRGPKGEPVTIYGQEWLCPSTGALEYTLDYTAGLVGKYRPDAVVMDNNEFYETPAGMTCYCEGCQAAFKKYVQRRFGPRVFGLETSTLRIPVSPGPLYNLWVLWRNRVWAEATEKFRAGLRAVRPDIVLFSNTQYLFAKNTLATDLQYRHEDIVISESTGLDLSGQVEKLLLGRALSTGRPLWNYLGTFNEKNFDLLQPPDVVARYIHATVACGVRPWIVYYGFTEDPEANRESLTAMARALNWHLAQGPKSQGLIPYAPLLSLVSHHSFNIRGSKLIPNHLKALRPKGMVSWIAEEKTLDDPGILEGCRVLLAEDVPCLEDKTLNRISEFVRKGGVLLASSEAGCFDEVGRRRRGSSLWEIMGVRGVPGEISNFGRGQARVVSFPALDEEIFSKMEPARFSIEPVADVIIVPYRDPSGRFTVYVLGEDPIPQDFEVGAPGGAHGSAILCFPGTLPSLGELKE